VEAASDKENLSVNVLRVREGRDQLSLVERRFSGRELEKEWSSRV